MKDKNTRIPGKIELKTLKDIEEHKSSYFSMEEKRHIALLDEDKIKAEAIKWVKELKNIIENNSVHSSPIKFGDFLINPSENYREIWSIIDFIKWAHNITEDELLPNITIEKGEWKEEDLK